MEAIAGLIHEVLTSTQPATTGGAVRKAAYVLDPAVAGRARAQAAEMLAGFPLYPSIGLG